MRITDRQKQLLDSLTCERLSSNEAHLRMVDSFFNGRNGSLEHTLKNEAYAEDEEGNIAFYLVKDADNRILFYFSVKLGTEDIPLMSLDMDFIKNYYNWMLSVRGLAKSTAFEHINTLK